MTSENKSAKPLAPNRPLDEYDTLALQYRELWVLVVFCIIGWITFSIGILLISKSLLGLLLAAAGVFVVAAPSIKVLRQMGFKMALDWDMYREVRYSDGRVERDSMGAENLALQIFKILLYLFVGIAATPIRYIKYTIAYLKGWKEKCPTRPPFTLSFLFPTVVGIGMFVVGLVIIIIGLAIML